MQGRRMIGTLALVAVMAAAVGAGTAVWAAHRFSDVDDTHPFHDEIALLGDACVAGGFPDGTFRPTNVVTRQAVAAFLARGLSRVEVADGPDAFLPGNDTGAVTEPMTLATVDIHTPDVPDCEQYVQLTGQATVAIHEEQLTACLAIACNVELELVDDEDNVVGITRTRFVTDWAAHSLAVTAVVAAPGGTGTYELQVRTWHLDALAGVVGDVRLVATTHPFSDTAASASAE
jgi:hypothetical protein